MPSPTSSRFSSFASSRYESSVPQGQWEQLPAGEHLAVLNTPKRPARTRGAAKGHTVARYRLRLIKEETVAEPETLILPSEIAAFLWQRV